MFFCFLIEALQLVCELWRLWCDVWKLNVKYFSDVDNLVILAPFVKKDLPVIELFCHLCPTSFDCVCIGPFLDSHFVPLINLSVLLPFPHCHYCCGFIVSLKPGGVIPVFFFKIVLAILDALHFHVNFTVSWFLQKTYRPILLTWSLNDLWIWLSIYLVFSFFQYCLSFSV